MDPEYKKYALKMVFYRALSGVIMVGVYAAFELASIYVYQWLNPGTATPQVMQ